MRRRWEEEKNKVTEKNSEQVCALRAFKFCATDAHISNGKSLLALQSALDIDQ